jgi:hypothetical protein
MTTGMMHPVLRHMDQAGFDAMEFFVAGRFKKVIREQLDNPWDWVRYGQSRSRLRYLAASPGLYPEPLYIPSSAEVGHRLRHQRARLSDPWSIATTKGRVKQMGMTSVVNPVYSISPRHRQYYARKRAGGGDEALSNLFRCRWHTLRRAYWQAVLKTSAMCGGVPATATMAWRHSVSSKWSGQHSHRPHFVPPQPTVRRSRRCSTSSAICALGYLRWYERSLRRWKTFRRCAKEAGLYRRAREYDQVSIVIKCRAA